MAQDAGSIFYGRTTSGTKINLYTGFRDGTGSRIHAVLINGELEYLRDDVSGLSCVVKGCGSIFV